MGKGSPKSTPIEANGSEATLSPAPDPGTLAPSSSGSFLSPFKPSSTFESPTLMDDAQSVTDDNFFSLLTGATRNLDTAENRLTDAAGTVRVLSDEFSIPQPRSTGFGKGARSYSTGGAVGFNLGGGLDAAFQQGFQQGALKPMISTPIPPSSDPYSSAAGLTPLMKPSVYSDVNDYNQGMSVGPAVNPQMLQAAQNFANPSVFSYNNPNQGSGGLSGMMPSGAPGSMNPMAGMQNQALPNQNQAMMPVQPYTKGT